MTEARPATTTVLPGAASYRRAVRLLLYAAAAAALAVLYRGAMARGAAGAWVAPLDDTYIHFQYAKLLARGEPFAWSPGDGYTTGATSLVWPLVLALPHAAGLSGGAVYALAFVFGAIALVVTAMLVASQLDERLGDPPSATAAGLAAVTGGSMLWGCFSGMEIPLAVAAWTSAAVVLSRWESGLLPGVPGLAALAALPLVRPEGVAVLAAVALVGRRQRGAWRALPVIAAPFALVLALNALLTGQALPNGAAAKSLLAGDLTLARAATALLRNTLGILGTFAVQGPPLLLPLGILAAGIALLRGGSRDRAAPALLLGTLAVVLANRYASWHHGRYLLPLLPLAMILAAPLVRDVAGIRWTRAVLLALVAANAALLPGAARTFERDVSDIARQHVAAGTFLARALPPDARVAVMDAGAVAYFSERRGIDLVGLGTNGMARSFLEGAGATYRALVGLPPDRRPTHFAVYPGFFPGFESVFGRELARFELPALSIAADPLLAVYEVRPGAFSAAEGALDPAAPPACDAVLPSDLASEGLHGASFDRLGTLVAPSPGPAGIEAPRAARVVARASYRLGCPGRERTRLRATLAAAVPTSVEIEVDGRRVDSARIEPGWTERVIALETGAARVRVTASPHVALARLALEPSP